MIEDNASFFIFGCQEHHQWVMVAVLLFNLLLVEAPTLTSTTITSGHTHTRTRIILPLHAPNINKHNPPFPSSAPKHIRGSSIAAGSRIQVHQLSDALLSIPTIQCLQQQQQRQRPRLYQHSPVFERKI